MIGGARDDFGALDRERLAILQERFGVERRVRFKPLALLKHVADDLVFDVRDVHHMQDFVAEIFQITAQHVDGDEGAEVADVTVIINRRAARIHPHPVAFERAELFEGARQRVSEPEHASLLIE